MKNTKHILFITLLAAIFFDSCSKMAPLNERQECGTKLSSGPVFVESTAISIGNGCSDSSTGNITDPDHDTDHDRDKAKPKVQ